jgi:hypothetical protein
MWEDLERYGDLITNALDLASFLMVAKELVGLTSGLAIAAQYTWYIGIRVLGVVIVAIGAGAIYPLAALIVFICGIIGIIAQWRSGEDAPHIRQLTAGPMFTCGVLLFGFTRILAIAISWHKASIPLGTH